MYIQITTERVLVFEKIYKFYKTYNSTPSFYKTGYFLV